MTLGGNKYALARLVIASCVIISKVLTYSGNGDINETINTSYFEKSILCKYCSESSIQHAIVDASKYTKIYVFTRENKQNILEMVVGNISSFLNSGFDVKKPTKLLIHGWLDSAFINFGSDIREAYLAANNVNILAVDWSPVAGLLYPIARVAVEPVGQYLAKFVDWLVSKCGLPIESIHIIGHSLGAHIGGVVGERISVGTISRITGLDPAGPGFDSFSWGRLDSSDAAFVDTIHTSGLWAGFFDPCGHVDFYPNRGIPNQPGCPRDFGKCSHIRAYKLFAESISSRKFVSKACGRWKDFIKGLCKTNISTVMGEHVDLRAKGSFYLHTAGAAPYALGNNEWQINRIRN